MVDIYIESNDGTLGPFSPDQVRQLLSEGKIPSDAPAWYRNGTNRGTVAEVLDHFFPPPKPAPLAQPALPEARKPQKRGWLGYLVVGIILVLCVPCCLGPIGGYHGLRPSPGMQATHAIILAMYVYANDHNGAYPDGKTSTEVFQKLVDEGYVTDPAVFYLQMPGKTKATSNKLTAENICFDVTGGVVQDSSDDVPVIFTTGYTVIYAPGAKAVRTAGEEAPFGNDGMAVAYKNNSAAFLVAVSDGSIALIPATFDPGKKTYRQLRP